MCYRLAGRKWAECIKAALADYPTYTPQLLVRLSPPPGLGVAEFRGDVSKLHRHFRYYNRNDYHYFSVLHWQSGRPHLHLLYKLYRDTELTKEAFRAGRFLDCAPVRTTTTTSTSSRSATSCAALDYVCWHRRIPADKVELAPRSYRGRHFCVSRGFLPRLRLRLLGQGSGILAGPGPEPPGRGSAGVRSAAAATDARVAALRLGRLRCRVLGVHGLTTPGWRRAAVRPTA